MKFGDYRSNGFQDIRGVNFVLNERTLAKPIPIARKCKAFRLKTNQPTVSRANCGYSLRLPLQFVIELNGLNVPRDATVSWSPTLHCVLPSLIAADKLPIATESECLSVFKGVCHTLKSSSTV